MSTISHLLQTSPLPPLEKELLLAHVLQKTRSWLLAHPHYNLDQTALDQFTQLQNRRQAHQPIAYLTHRQEFYGRNFYVDENVLIPRPATEKLVEQTLAYLENPHHQTVTADTDIVIYSRSFNDLKPKLIVEVGTGSGCVAITLALEADLPVLATDVSAAALDVAQKNAAILAPNQALTFKKSDLLIHLNLNQPFLVVSNPPYIPTTETLMPDVYRYEPHLALFGGTNGDNLINKLIEQASADPLCAGVVLECRAGQADLIRK